MITAIVQEGARAIILKKTMTGKLTWRWKQLTLTIVFILVHCPTWTSSANPCIEKTNVEPKYFYYGEEALNIRILTSSRLTHKIVSTIFQVFSEQVLGYANVSLVEIEDPRLSFEPDVQFANISSCEKNE